MEQVILKQTRFGTLCNQDWNNLEKDGDDRFCSHCSKNVLDFTSMNRDDIMAIIKVNPTTCSMGFRSDLEKQYLIFEIPAIDSRRPVFIAGFMGLLGFSEVSNAQSPAKPEIIRVETSCLDTINSMNTDATDTNSNYGVDNKEIKQVRRRPRQKYYVNGSFPFLHRVRRFRSLGCFNF